MERLSNNLLQSYGNPHQQVKYIDAMAKNNEYPTLSPVRLDKWLYAARFFKSRALATQAIANGKVIIEGQRPKPSRPLVIDMVITISTPLYEKTICVKFLGDKRQSAKIAQTWYEETDESLKRQAIASEARRKSALMHQSAPNPKARPDKHGRKYLRDLKRNKD